MRILFISRWLPYPPSNGSKLRVLHLLRQLADRHDVSLVSFAEPSELPQETAELKRICRSVTVVPRPPFRPQGLRARMAFLSRTPRSLVDTFSQAMSHAIRETLSEAPHDVVVASQLESAVYTRDFAGLPAVFEEIELRVLAEQFILASGGQQRLRYGPTWYKHRRYLSRLLRSFSACTVVSEAEGELLSRAVPGHPPVAVIPNCVRLTDYDGVRETPEAHTLIFAGALSYLPNLDAMRWFVGAVLPRISVGSPEVRLTITGDPAGVSLGSVPRVRQTGHVEDVRPIVAASWLSVAPLRYGGGTRLKILESMGLGTPVVSTRKGAEGLDVVSGEHLLLADSAEDFASCVSRLLADADLRARLAENGRRLVAERYEWATVGPRFEQFVLDVAVGGRS